MKKNTIVICALAAIALTVFFVRAKNSDSVGVRIVTVEQGPIYSVVRSTGRVRSDRESFVTTQAAGQIVGVLVKEGQQVRKGETLLTLDSREAGARVAHAEAALREADERVDQAARAKEGLDRLLQAGGISVQSFKDAESEFQIAVIARSKADSELRAAYLAKDRLNIRAPFSGLITKSSAHVGEWAAPGAPIISLTDTGTREIEALVDDVDAGQVAVGQIVEITCDAFPLGHWMERVVRVTPAVQKEGTANTIMVHVSLSHKAGELRFGQQVDANIRTAYKEKAMKVPFDALISANGGLFLALIHDGSVHLEPARTGIESTTHVEILNAVQPGQEIILTENKQLREGQHVYKIQDAATL